MKRALEGRALELFFIDGRPEGMLTATVFNWTGHVLMFPRTQISNAVQRQEASLTGVYILLGEKDGKETIYVGEAEDIGVRIRQHAASKDWWTSAVLVTAADKLNKAHVKYVESRLVEIALDVGAVSLENANTPPRPSLAEAQVSNMEVFVETLLMVLPAVRVDAFLSRRRRSKTASDESTVAVPPTFELINKKNGIQATAKLENGEFIVQAGSLARSAWSGDVTDKTSYWKLHEDLCERGILRPNGETLVFAEDYAFSSTSAAGAVVNGRTTRGPTEWKVRGTKKSYRDWETEQLASEQVT
ncbi:MAG: GIY-YIG nuclease family protein [Pseudomonadota bacterium]